MKAKTLHDVNWWCPSCGAPKLLGPKELETYLAKKSLCRRCRNKERNSRS